MIEAARKEGIEVTIDQYPYTASSTSISTLIPDEILADGQDSINVRLQRPEIKKYVIKSMLARLKKRKLNISVMLWLLIFNPIPLIMEKVLSKSI
jgi:N-acyl-D-amino-acid deacylase